MKTLAREQDADEILRRVRMLRHDSDRRWGRMSPHQMVCHLNDGYRMMIGERPNEMIRPPLPRFMMRWIALYLPLAWPEGRIPTTPELDQQAQGTKPATFEADVADLDRLLRTLAAEWRDRRIDHPHPMFGRMSASAWMRWAYLHADHHLRQFGV